MRIIISGGKGFLGSHLVPELTAHGHEVLVWSRSAGADREWDPVSGPPPAGSFEAVDAVVYLSGESVAHRWSDELKKKIHDSRVVGARNLVDGIAAATDRPKVLVCSSATGYYGDRGEQQLTENDEPGAGFLADVCRQWEAEASRAAGLGLRAVELRTGMVLGNGGGALARLVSAFKSKMGGKLGSGQQWTPWIHVADIAGLYRFALENEVSGPMNGASPNPVRNEEFTEALATVIHEPGRMSVPEFALKMMFGEMSSVLLASQRVIPAKALESGFQFRFPLLQPALANLLGSST